MGGTHGLPRGRQEQHWTFGLTANNPNDGPSMAQTDGEIFIVGLRNAHAMETQAAVVGASVGALDEYPEVRRN